ARGTVGAREAGNACVLVAPRSGRGAVLVGEALHASTDGGIAQRRGRKAAAGEERVSAVSRSDILSCRAPAAGEEAERQNEDSEWRPTCSASHRSHRRLRPEARL